MLSSPGIWMGAALHVKARGMWGGCAGTRGHREGNSPPIWDIGSKSRTDSLDLGTRNGKRKEAKCVYRQLLCLCHRQCPWDQERGLLTAKGKTNKNKQEILDLLAALWFLYKLALIHSPGHQRADIPMREAEGRLSGKRSRRTDDCPGPDVTGPRTT